MYSTPVDPDDVDRLSLLPLAVRVGDRDERDPFLDRFNDGCALMPDSRPEGVAVVLMDAYSIDMRVRRVVPNSRNAVIRLLSHVAPYDDW